MTNLIPFSLIRWELKSQESSVTFPYGDSKASGPATISSPERREIFHFWQDTGRCIFTMVSPRQKPPPAAPQESLVNPRALHSCFPSSAGPAAVAIKRLGHCVTCWWLTGEGPGPAMPLPLAADMKSNQIPHNKRDNKTQRGENARGSERVTETTVEPN